MGKVGFAAKVPRATVKLSHWVPLALPHEIETKQQLMVVRILTLGTYAVSSSSLADP